MKIRLSKAIAELEGEKVRYAWQPPDIYDDVHDDNIWLVYGRKGSGKSTLVDYLGAEKESAHSIVIRPRDTDLFSRILASIPTGGADDRAVEESIVTILDFVFTVRMMKEIVPLEGVLPPGSSRETIYNFLVNNKFHEGSVLRKAVRFISNICGDKIKPISELSAAIDRETGKINYSDAKEALFAYAKKLPKRVLLCVDDIDEIGFSFSNSDRRFVNALIVFMVRNNLAFLDKKLKIRILLTAPSELFFHSSLWGSDWVSSKSKCLNWLKPEQLHDLVNKRIAIEMNIRKSRPRFQGDVYSIEAAQTWNRVFPLTIHNKLGRSESTFDYILRHTFYTPRQVLDVCDTVLRKMDGDEILGAVKPPFSDADWSELFQDCVEKFTIKAEKDFRDVFSKIYTGLDDVVGAFRLRPNIWNWQQLHDFCQEEDLRLKRIDTGDEFKGDTLINILQQIGFLGLGSRTFESLPGTETFNMRFAFLEEYPSRKASEIAVIAPLFYDAYDIKPVETVIIQPHTQLRLPNSILLKIGSYDPTRNCFRC